MINTLEFKVLQVDDMRVTDESLAATAEQREDDAREFGEKRAMQIIALKSQGVSPEEIATKTNQPLVEVVKIIEDYQRLLH